MCIFPPNIRSDPTDPFPIRRGDNITSSIQSNRANYMETTGFVKHITQQCLLNSFAAQPSPERERERERMSQIRNPFKLRLVGCSAAQHCIYSICIGKGTHKTKNRMMMLTVVIGGCVTLICCCCCLILNIRIM